MKRPAQALAALLLLPQVAAASGGDIGIPRGTPRVPTETLPPNQVLRQIEAQSERIRAMRGKALFAYAPVEVVDRLGQPIVDPASGKPREDRFCIVWRQGSVLDNADLKVVGEESWYQSVSYRVDPRSRYARIYRVKGPNVVQTPVGLRELGGQVAIDPDMVVPMYDQPRPDWPCKTEVWLAVLDTPERQYYRPVVVPWRAGDRIVPERDAANPCRYTTGGVVPSC